MTIDEKEIQAQLMRLISSQWISQPIYVAAELGIAEILSEGPKAVSTIADECGACEPYLYRVLRALASVGIFIETEDGVFGLTPMAESLGSDRMRSIARMFLSGWHMRAWEYLLHSVRTGDSAFETAHGLPAFEWFDRNEDARRVFQEANAVKARNSHAAVLDVYDFSSHSLVADIGGGYGGLLFTVLEARPHLKGIIADLPVVAVEVRELIRSRHLDGRCTVAACDFFSGLPPAIGEADCLILSHVLHDWDDGKCSVILRNCARAMSSGARLLAVESIVPGKNEFSVAKLLDLEVLVMGGGRERTEEEFRMLLADAGFFMEKILPTRETVSILVCRKN